VFSGTLNLLNQSWNDVGRRAVSLWQLTLLNIKHCSFVLLFF